MHNFIRATPAKFIASIFYCITAFTLPLSAQTTGMDDVLEIEQATQHALRQLTSETPDFKGLDDLPGNIQKKIAAHKLDADAVWAFYSTIAPLTHSNFGVMNVMAWLQREPTARLPLLATQTAQLLIFGGNLRYSYFTTAAWHETAEIKMHLKEVRSHLAAARETVSRDPQWYLLMAEFMLAMRDDEAALTRLVKDGIKADPSNIQLAVIAANRFLPKWNGDADKLEAFARYAAELYPSAERKAVYARIYWQAHLAQYQGHLFSASRLDWDYLMQGLRDLVAQRPSEAHLNQALALACLGGNRTLAKEILLHPSYTYSDRYWRHLNVQEGAYKPCRAWAGS